MKKIIYLAFVDYYNSTDGVARKINMQIKAMEQNGAQVECITYGKEGIAVYNNNSVVFEEQYKKRIPRRFQLLRIAQDYLEKNKADIIFMRFAYSDPIVCHFLKSARKDVEKIIVEISSYPYRYKGTFFRSKKVWLIQLVDRITFQIMSKYVDKYYVIGEPVKRLGNVDAVNIPNGIVNSEYKKKEIRTSDTINIMCLATMYAYQGYERLIQGLNEYLRKGGKRKYKIHLVGDGPELPRYKEIVEIEGMQDFVIFHGEKSGKDLDDLFDLCDIACSTLAPHRRQIIYASPLKGKEYMLRGIPYVYAYSEIGITDDFPYLCHIDSADTPIDMMQLEMFYEKYEQHKQEYSTYLHDYALTHFDWKNILADL